MDHMNRCDEFKSIISHNRNDHHCDFHHHEDSPSFQRRFQKHVHDLIAEFKSLGNAVLVDEISTELIQMGSRDVMPEVAIKTVRNIEDIAQKQFKEFRASRIIKHVTPVEAPIKKNKLMVFKTCNTKGQTRSKSD